MAFAVDVGHVQGAQLAGAQAATIKQQHDQAVPAGGRAGAGRGLDEALGLLEGQGLGRSLLRCVLQTEAVEHVALGAAAAPGVVQQAAEVAQVLGQAGVRPAPLPLGLEPVQVVLQAEAPEIHAGTPVREAGHCPAQRATDIDDGAWGFAADLVQVDEVALD